VTDAALGFVIVSADTGAVFFMFVIVTAAAVIVMLMFMIMVMTAAAVSVMIVDMFTHDYLSSADLGAADAFGSRFIFSHNSLF
jgi:uncharacterized SAM-binding protein YcdF (DUF218 family)